MGLKAKLLYDLNLLKFRYWQKNRRFIIPLYKNSSGKSKFPRTIVCMCDGRIRSGGLGDRIHGILSLYFFCKINDLNFKINFCDPFRLKDYLAPNEVDWDVEPEDLCYDLHGTEPFMMACSFRANGASVEQEADFMYRYLLSRVETDSVKEFHIYTNMHYVTDCNLYSKLFHILFKPTQPLLDAIEWNKQRIAGSYVSVTLRFQNLLGDFEEGNYPTLPNYDQNILIESVKNKICDLHRIYHPGKKILVTSDSRKFLNIIDEEDWAYTIPGNLVHMSYTPIHDFDTHLKSFVDLFMLADAEKLYLLVTGEMYHSGFAESASFINQRPYEVINW